MSFTAQHVSRTHTIRLSATTSQAFPLFEPIGEKAWAEGWEPHMLFPADGVAELGAVFTTAHPTESESIWIMPVYDPANFHLAYLRVTPGSRLAHLDIQCQEAPGGTTDASVTYVFTALSEQGNEFIDRFTEAYYQAMLEDWERAINYYLAHGHLLPHHQILSMAVTCPVTASPYIRQNHRRSTTKSSIKSSPAVNVSEAKNLTR